ncbi:MAG: ATP-binding cassette domain-containing protein [Erysipelotrichales bacterium]
MEIISIEDLSFTYILKEEKVLSDVNLKINEGDFVVVCGDSGCGKSTLIKHLKNELRPYGTTEGTILYKNKDIKEMSLRESATSIGYVMQNPDNQIATDKVWHELAFGLENIGVEPSIIRRRVAEMANFFGIHTLFREDSDSLSGGQKQILNLAATMLLQPEVLVLDEPTSQLDPITATDFIETLHKINEEFGTTIILVEHRLEDVFKVANKVVLMDEGKILATNTPQKIASQVKEIDDNHNFFNAIPTPTKVALDLNYTGKLPVTIKEGKIFLKENYSNIKNKVFEFEEDTTDKKEIISLKGVYFRYYKEGNDILRGVNLSVKESEIFCLLGGNGAGKTTTINNIAGISKPYRGKIIVDGKEINKRGNALDKNYMVYLPQNPTLLFSKDSVKEEIDEEIHAQKKANPDVESLANGLIEQFNLSKLMGQHPYDISGGEQQKVAMLKVLLRSPSILLLDEPTKGLDATAKKVLAEILSQLKDMKITIMIVSHDIEFCARYGTRCAMFFDGEVISQDSPRKFFNNNNFYTTAASKLTRNIFENTVLGEDVVRLCMAQEH